jgi:hypothetical protein
MDEWYPVQVKQKDKAGRPDIDVCPGPFAEENYYLGMVVAH